MTRAGRCEAPIKLVSGMYVHVCSSVGAGPPAPRMAPRRVGGAFTRYAREKFFQQIDTSHKDVSLVHERPYIFVVPNLFSADECARLRAKAEGALAPQTFDDAVPRQRSSHGTTVRHQEVPTLRARLAALANVSLSQLQPLKVSRYREGERFDIHTDAIRGALDGTDAEEDDWWGDRARIEHGVVGAPISGV